MNLKATKRGLIKKQKYESKLSCSLYHYHVHCSINFGLNKKVSCAGFLRGNLRILKHLYLNNYAEFHSKISNIMFFLFYLLVCKISTVRTLA